MSYPLVPERVRAVYQEVWHEFFDWEREYNMEALASLTPTSADASPSTAEEALEDERIISSEGAAYIDLACAKVYRYTSAGKITSEVVSCPTYSCSTIKPLRPYEAYTYSHKNIYIADDVCEKLPFMPFADDPGFAMVELLECYDSIAWEIPRKDPDYDMIVAEAVRRLHFRFGISFSAIDETGILPIAIVEQPDRKGLLHVLSQRDTLSWVGSLSSDLPALPQTDAPLPISLRKRVSGIRYLFCANLNCVEPYCPTHLNMDEQIKKPTSIDIDGDEKGKRDPPCGYDCYKYNSDELEGLAQWDTSTIEDFKFILESATDLSSCDLAVVCDNPCREIYAHRRIYASIRSEDKSAPSSSEKDVTGCGGSDSDLSSLDEKPIFNDVVRGPNASDALPPSEICQHLGECNAHMDCRCYRENLHCHRNCLCDLSCRRRPKGCRCKNYSKKRCRTYKCPCFKAGRECDPELCQKCGAKGRRPCDRLISYYSSDLKSITGDVNKNGGCRNNSLQHGISKAIEVKDGAYGLGLFLIEVAREGDLVGEYIGEIINDKMADARGVLTRHLGRNYLFGLNEEWTIDAASVGNEMRFINHAAGNMANCRAEVREVNGDHRIGIYVVKKVIQPGEELFMDYGKEYFIGGVTGETPRAESKR